MKTEYVMVPVDPEITAEMKAKHIGEYRWVEYQTSEDENGDVQAHEYFRTVPWGLCKEIFNRMYADIIAAAPKPSAEPVFWYRQRSDGGYEGPVHNSGIGDIRKNSGAWSPLYADQPPAVAVQEQPAPIPTSEFERGALTAIALIVRTHDEPSIAADVLNQMGLNNADCSGVDEYDHEDLASLCDGETIKLTGLTRPQNPEAGV